MVAWADADREWMGKLAEVAKRKTKPKEAHTFVNLKAAEYGRRGTELQALRATYKASTNEFFAALTELVQFQIAKGLSTETEMRSGLERIVAIDSTVRAARDTYAEVANSFVRLPEITREFRAQKRRLSHEIELLSADIGTWLDRSAEMKAKFNLAAQSPS